MRLRQGERFTLARIGASQGQIILLMATEVVTVILVSTALSALLVMLTNQYGMQMLQQLLLS